MSWIGVVPTSCACPQFNVFAEPVDFGSSRSLLLRMEQKRQDDLACDEEPWCLPGSDSSDGRSELDSESEVSNFPPNYGYDRSTSASSLPSGENLLASGDDKST